MAKPIEDLSWATNVASLITEPSVPQRDLGYKFITDAGVTKGQIPTGQQFNFFLNAYFKWTKYFEISTVQYPIVMGSAAQVTSGDATNVITDLNDTLVLENSKVLILTGTHVLTSTITLSNDGIEIISENKDSIIDNSSFNFDFTGSLINVSVNTNTELNSTFTIKSDNIVFINNDKKSPLALAPLDLRLFLKEDSSNPTFQINISFEQLTLYDDNNSATLETSTSPFTLDMSVTGAGGRASAEGSGSEQNSTWYYAYVYSDGQGTINGLISDKPSWSLIAPGDKPSGSFFTRRVSPLFNDASGNIREYRQINDVIYLNNSSTTSIASLLQIFSGNFVGNLDLSTFIPIIAYQAKITTTGASFDPSTVFFGSPTSAGGTFAQSILNQNSVSDILVSDPSSIQIYMGDITEIYLISYRIDL